MPAIGFDANAIALNLGSMKISVDCGEFRVLVILFARCPSEHCKFLSRHRVHFWLGH